MTMDRIGDDETVSIPRIGRPRPVPTLLAALASAALTAVLCGGAQFGGPVFAGAVFVVQVALIASWCLAARPPAPIGVAVVGAGAALAADLLAVLGDDATLAPLAGVIAAAFGATIITQLTRGVARRHVTETFGSTATLVVAMVALASTIFLHRQSGGPALLTAFLLVAGVGLAAARLTDLIWPFPAVNQAVPRGVVGLVVGSLVGAVGLVALSGTLSEPLSVPLAALAGWGVALAGILADLAVAYGSAGRALVGDVRKSSPLRPLLGPLLGMAVAAPAGYIFGLVLLS